MTFKIVSQLDGDSYFAGPVMAYESPLEPGVFLIPGGAVDTALPMIPEGKRAKWVDAKWAFEDLVPQTDEAAALEDIVNEVIVDPLDKLKSFLLANPDVASLLAGAR